jgi:hypothetical protein
MVEGADNFDVVAIFEWECEVTSTKPRMNSAISEGRTNSGTKSLDDIDELVM